MTAQWFIAAGIIPGLHEIRGPIPAPTLPPFALSAAITLAAAGTGVLALVRNRRSPAQVPPERHEDLEGQLCRLRTRYEQNQLTELQLVENLCTLLRFALGPERPELTNAELLVAAKLTLPEESLRLVNLILTSCDAVRYGRATLERDPALRLLELAAAVSRHLPEMKT